MLQQAIILPPDGSLPHFFRRLLIAIHQLMTAGLALGTLVIKYVSARKSDDVFVISLEDRRLIKRIPVGDYPQRMWTTRVPRRKVSRLP